MKSQAFILLSLNSNFSVCRSKSCFSFTDRLRLRQLWCYLSYLRVHPKYPTTMQHNILRKWEHKPMHLSAQQSHFTTSYCAHYEQREDNFPQTLTTCVISYRWPECSFFSNVKIDFLVVEEQKRCYVNCFSTTVFTQDTYLAVCRLSSLLYSHGADFLCQNSLFYLTEHSLLISLLCVCHFIYCMDGTWQPSIYLWFHPENRTGTWSQLLLST